MPPSALRRRTCPNAARCAAATGSTTRAITKRASSVTLSLIHIFLRTYIAARWGVGAMEMTSDEIIEAMRSEELPDKARMDLTAILRDADLVKFAKATPDGEQNEADYLKAFYFVEETKLVVEEEEPEQPDPMQNQNA